MTRKATMSDAIQRAIDETLMTLGTSIPGYVLSFDSSTQLAEVQIGIKRVSKDGEQSAPPPIIRVPVLFSGGTYRVEHQIDVNDEGLIIFSQRCIDTWIDQGGVSNNPILRKHDITDGIFIPGLRSQPNKLSDFENNGIRITDGSNYFWLKNDGNGEINVSTLTINGNIVHNGDQTTSGTVTANTKVSSPSIEADGKEVANHTHPAGTPPGDTGVNN